MVFARFGMFSTPATSVDSGDLGHTHVGCLPFLSRRRLTSKLEAMARNRVASIKRERLNLQHVMDMLADGDGDEAGMTTPAAGKPNLDRA